MAGCRTVYKVLGKLLHAFEMVAEISSKRKFHCGKRPLGGSAYNDDVKKKTANFSTVGLDSFAPNAMLVSILW
jgi:hypothetical protein